MQEPASGPEAVIEIWNRRAREFGFEGVAGLLNSMRHGDRGSPGANHAPRAEATAPASAVAGPEADDPDSDGGLEARRAFVQQQALDFAAKHNFARRLNFSAEMHWFFYEARVSLEAGRFLASALCYMHGIEATVRWLHREAYPHAKPDLEDQANFSHRLLRELQAVGYRVETLAFPGEADFLTKIQTSKPHVELLRQRNNIAHGNAAEYFQTVPETSDRIFTPECLRDLARTLHEVSDAWTREIARRRSDGASAGASAGGE